MKRTPSAPRQQTGVGMIEVLIAVLVLSIGFLGFAALEAKSLSTNNSAMARSMATINSFSILDAMRADITNAKNGVYNGTVTANACPAADTTSFAKMQLNQWCTQLATLGNAASTTGTIACDASGTCKITVQFDDTRSGKLIGSDKQQFVTQAML